MRVRRTFAYKGVHVILFINVNFFFCLDEELIKWGWPEDVWFHVDKLSSAHVYLRLNKVLTYS